MTCEPMRIQGNTFLITGGCSGLGRGCVDRVLKEGGNAVIADLNADAGESLQKEHPGRIFFHPTDVASEESVKELITGAAGKFGKIRGAINCAGVASATRLVSKRGAHSLSSFEKVIRINLIGTFNVCRLAAEHMMNLEAEEDGERGVLINTASVAAFDGQIGQAAYSASKGGVAAMTLPLARDLAMYGIRVMTIAPGTFDTSMLGGLPSTIRTALEEQTPFPSRLGRPEEFAALAAHILENRMLNGETIRLDGALRMPPK